MIRLLGWEPPYLAALGVFSSDAQRMPYRKDGNCMGDEGKAVGSTQAPAALLSNPHPKMLFIPTITVDQGGGKWRSGMQKGCCAKFLASRSSIVTYLRHLRQTVWRVDSLWCLNRRGDRLMGYVQQSGHRARTLRKRELKSRNEIEQLREANRQLREMVAQLSELAVARIADEAGRHKSHNVISSTTRRPKSAKTVKRSDCRSDVERNAPQK
jgi:hypothetical protein